MLAIYFALSDNYRYFTIKKRVRELSKKLVIQIRSDSASTIDQLKGLIEIRMTSYIIFAKIYKVLTIYSF